MIFEKQKQFVLDVLINFLIFEFVIVDVIVKQQSNKTFLSNKGS